MQLGELREACKQKQVEIDIKFAVGDNSEKVLIEQASSAGATTLIIGTSDRFAHLQRRSRGSYCIRNAPAGCSVITVRNSKILHYRDNPVKVPNKSHTISSAEENFIGKGGYAEVYKGSLADGQLVAVKRLTRGQTEEQRVNDFLTELGIMVHINHPNTTHLIGFGIEGGFHLVFEFSLHGSLASWLHGPKSELLDWDIRYRVALGTARGLLYLHEGCRRRIIHRDIKASNILLTKEFEPQISDFGLAKWLPKQWTHHTITPIEGTFGYLAPEYFMYGIVDEKTDVFSFGVLLLELITGRLPVNSSQQSLVIWAKPLLESRNIEKLVDPRLADAYNVQQMNFMVLTAALCIQQAAVLRPGMRRVLQLLNGEEENLESSEPWTMPLLESPYLHDTDEYSSTRYQTDLNRHREVALEF